MCFDLMQAPIIPVILHDGDTRNFDVYPEFNMQSLDPSSKDDVALFLDFWVTLHGNFKNYPIVNT